MGSELRSGPMLARNRKPSLVMSNWRGGVMDCDQLRREQLVRVGGLEVAFVLLAFPESFDQKSGRWNRLEIPISLAWLSYGKQFPTKLN